MPGAGAVLFADSARAPAAVLPTLPIAPLTAPPTALTAPPTALPMAPPRPPLRAPAEAGAVAMMIKPAAKAAAAMDGWHRDVLDNIRPPPPKWNLSMRSRWLHYP